MLCNYIWVLCGILVWLMFTVLFLVSDHWSRLLVSHHAFSCTTCVIILIIISLFYRLY